MTWISKEKRVRVDVVAVMIACVAGFAGGWVAGFRLGTIVSDRRAWRYWALNLAALLLGLVGNVAGLSLGQTWLWVASVTFLPAALTGLKYGRGKTVGPGSRMAPECEPLEIPPLWED